MDSFIDLTASNVWSEADIKARLHAEIRSEVSEYAETELNRALQGAALGMHTLSDAEMASLMHFKQATDRVAELGTQARADMALLHQVLALEGAQSRLGQPAVEAVTDDLLVVTNQEALDADLAERVAAQAIVDAASPQALALVLLRKPVVVPEPAPDPSNVVLP